MNSLDKKKRVILVATVLICGVVGWLYPAPEYQGSFAKFLVLLAFAVLMTTVLFLWERHDRKHS